MRNPYVYLSLGSNLGDRLLILQNAIRELSLILSDVEVSRTYTTSPRYVSDQPDFLNAAARGRTDRDPFELLTAVQGIETAFGRNRRLERRKGPRSLDIDILLFEDRVIETRDLVIPHPLMKERKFVLFPLLDLEPRLSDPITGEYYCSSAAKLTAQGIYYSSLNEYTATFQIRAVYGKGDGGSITGE